MRTDRLSKSRSRYIELDDICNLNEQARGKTCGSVFADKLWRESYYFNLYDENTGYGLISTIGILPNRKLITGFFLVLKGRKIIVLKPLIKYKQPVFNDYSFDLKGLEYIIEGTNWRLKYNSGKYNLCIVPKRFRIDKESYESMKLTRRKVRWIIKQKDSGESTRIVAKVMDITPRRIQQIWKYYRENNTEPVIGKNLGRPKRHHPEFEREIVREVKQKYKCGAVRLERFIEKIYNIHIPHNRIHMYLLDDNLAKEEPNKKRRRKWIRYERKHSMSAGHIDWCEKGINGTKVCAILDDSSRKILAGGEFRSANTENTKKVVDQMVKEYWDIRPLRELIMDHGSEFGAHRIDEKGEWNSEFKAHLSQYGIKPILARVNHPQTNGKIEKWFDFYRRYRHEFNTFEEFIEWYNEVRPHGSLDLDNLETPAQAFWRRLPPECVLGIANKMFRW